MLLHSKRKTCITLKVTITVYTALRRVAYNRSFSYSVVERNKVYTTLNGSSKLTIKFLCTVLHCCYILSTVYSINNDTENSPNYGHSITEACRIARFRQRYPSHKNSACAVSTNYGIINRNQLGYKVIRYQ